jgi:hypothetical protein
MPVWLAGLPACCWSKTARPSTALALTVATYSPTRSPLARHKALGCSVLDKFQMLLRVAAYVTCLPKGLLGLAPFVPNFFTNRFKDRN